MPGNVRGSLGRCGDFRILDLSATGAMIEHGHQLTPGETCSLSLRLAELDLRLQARVAWCHAHNGTTGRTGEEETRFQSGVQFLQLPEAVEAHIRQYLSTLTESNARPIHGLG